MGDAANSSRSFPLPKRPGRRSRSRTPQGRRLPTKPNPGQPAGPDRGRRRFRRGAAAAEARRLGLQAVCRRDNAAAAQTPARVAALPKKSVFHLYLLMGQSNMVGRDTSGIDAQVDNPRILALNGNNQWVIAREPMHVGGSGIGPGLSFAAAMLKANPRSPLVSSRALSAARL